MDMVLYSLLKKDMQDFDFVSGFKIVEVSELPQELDENTIYIINPNVDAEGIKGLVEKFNALIESEGGKVVETNEWGMKKLAYPIKKFTQGYYVLVNFEAKAEFVDELERIYKITDNVIKFITIRKED